MRVETRFPIETDTKGLEESSNSPLRVWSDICEQQSPLPAFPQWRPVVWDFFLLVRAVRLTFCEVEPCYVRINKEQRLTLEQQCNETKLV